MAPALAAQIPGLRAGAGCEPRDTSEPASSAAREGGGPPGDPAVENEKELKHSPWWAGFFMAGVGAGVTQETRTPQEWGEGAAGYGRRFANALAKHWIDRGIQFGVAKLAHEEFGYRRSEKHGFGPRLKYALLSMVITRKTTTGNKTFSKHEVAGAIGSGLISRLWQPASTRTILLGFSSAGTSLAVDAGIHVLREFWPDIRHPHAHASVTAPAAAVAAEASIEAPEPEAAPAPADEQAASDKCESAP
jgi:hypothetical protein